MRNFNYMNTSSASKVREKLQSLSVLPNYQTKGTIFSEGIRMFKRMSLLPSGPHRGLILVAIENYDTQRIIDAQF